jgi:hypothetical protein
LATTASAEVIVDGDFASWSFSSYNIGGGSATMTVEANGGNPGARLNVTTVTGVAQTAFGTGVKTDFSTGAPLSGDYTLSLDVLSGAGAFGQGQAIQLLVEQSGSVYAATVSPPVTGFPLNPFTTLQFTGTFTPGLFTRVIGAGPAAPTFDGSVTTRFGFAAGNQNSATLTQYYDNFRLEIPSLQSLAAAPALNQTALLLLGFGLAAIGTLAIARRARGVLPHRRGSFSSMIRLR